MNVPLIQKPETNDINASLIAIRKQLQFLNESVNNIESKYLLKSELKELSADTVGGDGKYIESISESNGIINAVEKNLGNMTPVDTVTLNNTHSVTSGAVYEALLNYVTNSTLSDYATISELNSKLAEKLTIADNYAGQSFGSSTMDDIDFLKAVLSSRGSPSLTCFGYSWATNTLVKFYNGSTNVANLDTNGGAIVFIRGNCGVNNWGLMTYVMISGRGNYGSALTMVIGTITYNGGSTISRTAKVFS